MTNFLAQFSQFHFLRPDWFWIIIPLAIFWLLKLKMVTTTQWHQVIPSHLANAMLGNNKQNKVKQKKWFVPYIWLLTVIALAGPTWEKIEKPVFQVKRASVIVLDMSMSMRATDIKPNRLSKARYKAIDLANAITDGEVALVAYAGDAFTISPLTPDTRNITALIPSLKPEIMPVQGSYPLMGLTKATELLQQAGYPNGDIYWITDGIESEDVPDLTTFAGQTPYRINIMTVGTSEGAPIKMLDSSLLKDHLGSIVIPKLNNRDLMSFSNISNGVFVNTTATDADIRTLLAASVSRPQEQQSEAGAESNGNQSNDNNSLTGDDWQELGPYIILLILPFVLVFFRKGAGILLMLVLPFSFTPNKVMAADNDPVPSANTTDAKRATSIPTKKSWTDYAFKTQDQVGTEQFNNQQFDQASESFKNTQWKGAAAYKAGDYENALNYFSKDKSAQGLYNQGNTLANLNKLEEAIKAYDESLKLDPNNESTLANKKLLEQLKQQQDQQQKQENDQQQNQDGEQEKDQQDGQDQKPGDESDQESKNDPDQKSESGSDQQKSDQEKSDSKDSSNSDSQSDQAPEPTPSESQETPEQQGESNPSEQEQKSEEEGDAQGESEKQDKATEQKAQATQTELSEEQIENKEQEQKIQQLLRKVSDDPATLLRNKMILESKKRQQKRSPKGATKSW